MKKFKKTDSYFNALNDEYGCIMVENITISDNQLNEAIAEIALNWSNLLFVFSRNSLLLTKSEKNLLVERFLPSNKPSDITQFVTKLLDKDHKFYSFFAESLLAIILRDVFGYKLCSSVLTTDDTLLDGHTGSDVCLYDRHSNKIVLGEAKFYKNIREAINTIKNDFTKSNGLKNKLDSLYRKAKNNRASKRIIIKEAGVENIKELSLDEFLTIDLVFTGFILYEEGSTNIDAKGFCDLCNFDSDDVKNNINSLFNLSLEQNYSLVMIKLPINSKVELITKVIEEAYILKERL